MATLRRDSFDSDCSEGYFEGYSLNGNSANETPSPGKGRIDTNPRSFDERVGELMQSKARDLEKQAARSPKRRRFSPIAPIAVSPDARMRARPPTPAPASLMIRPGRSVSFGEPMATTPPTAQFASLRAALASQGESTAADALLDFAKPAA